MFLTKDELVELTKRHRSDCQIKALKSMGIEHRVRMDGTPAVLTEHIKRVFGIENDVAMMEKAFEPNWSAM